LSDQGKEVDGNLMAEICRILDIDKQHTSTYKPSTNAAVERLYRTLNSIMGKLVESHRDWDSMLPFVMAAYRSSRHEATNYTPNFLLLGKEVRAPVDVVYGMPEKVVSVNYDDYAEEMEDRMRTAYTFVRQNLQRAAERSKRYYDLRVRPQKYKIGDWVYYYNPRKFAARQKKWQRQYNAPFLVVKVLGPTNLLIQRSKRQKPFVVHNDKVKPYVAEVMPRSWLNTEPVKEDQVEDHQVDDEIRSIIEQAQNDQIEEAPNVVSKEEPNEPIEVPVTVDATDRNLPVDLDVDQSNPEYDDSRNVQIIAGVPSTNYRSPRPRRNAGRPRRYLD